MRKLSAAALIAAIVGSCAPAAVARPIPPYRSLTVEAPIPATFGRFGDTSHTVGDIDRDGVRDVIVSDETNVGAAVAAGRVWVFSGRTQHVILALESPAPQDFAIFGGSMAGLGDVNGDGVPDLAIGEPFRDVYTGSGPLCGQPEPNGCNEDQGRVYVMSGRNGSLLYTVEAPHPQPSGLFGALNATRTDDLNGDGVADLVETENGEDIGAVIHAGAAYVISGKDGAIIRRIPNPQPQTYPEPELIFSMGLTNPGDVSGDGHDDLMIGFTATTVGGRVEQGRAYLFDGAGGAQLRVFDDPVAQTGAQFGGGYGDPGAPGDVDRDGVPDVMVDAEGESAAGLPGVGRAYIFSGRSGLLLTSLTTPLAQDSGFFGFIFSDAGDLNGDGTRDVLVGQTGSRHGGILRAGGTWVFDPRTGDVLADFTGLAPDAGQGVASTGDANGDGYPDYFATAPRAAVGDQLAQGVAFALISQPLPAAATVQAPAPPPPPPPPPPASDRTRPLLSALTISPRAFAAARPGAAGGGSRIAYRLSEAATVRFAIARRSLGRRVAGTCRAPRPSFSLRASCVRYVAIGTFKQRGAAGRNTLRFRGFVGGRRLAHARYRLTATATDAAANRSTARRATFTVKARRVASSK